jgi:cation diffusion facilitator CzcD-associated flavoprotein CzcO
VHPQHWPQSLDYCGKNVVVIGSGATAVTLVPAMSDKVKHITMLQRSPTYVASLPAEDPIAVLLMSVLPARVAHFINRWKNIAFGTFWYSFCKAFPRLVKYFIVLDITRRLGPEYERHFTPSYNPWDQRFCVVPDGDLFTALQSGKASIVTDTIETFTETGIKVHGSQEELPADIIVTATGLRIKLCGGIRVIVNGNEVKDMKRTFMYKGVMLSGVPNFILSVGYTNLTFTLKVDLIGTYLCRLLHYMDRNGYRKCYPEYGARPGESPEDEGEDLIDLSSGYLRRSMHLFPRQGMHSPWRYYQNYFWDMWEFKFNWLNDGVMKFS